MKQTAVFWFREPHFCEEHIATFFRVRKQQKQAANYSSIPMI
jgi:hypothetical protein